MCPYSLYVFIYSTVYLHKHGLLSISTLGYKPKYINKYIIYFVAYIVPTLATGGRWSAPLELPLFFSWALPSFLSL